MRSLGRIAFVLTGDQDAADDLVADSLLAAWRRWDEISATDRPVAYVRRILVNLATSRVRRLVRDRERMRHLEATFTDVSPGLDIGVVVDVRSALERLSDGQRVCVVLRYGLDMSEAEVADLLKINVGTVKSQTSKGARRLRSLLGEERSA